MTLKRKPPKLRLIQGGRGLPPVVVPGKTLLEDIRRLSHDEAASFVIGEIRDYIHSRGVYRVGRLNLPGFIEVMPLPGGHNFGLRTVVAGRSSIVTGAPTISIAAFTLLEWWEAEPDDAG